MFNQYFIGGCLFWGCMLLLLYIICFRAQLHETAFEEMGHRDRLFTAALVLCIVLLCTIPMQLSPICNLDKDNPYGRQYEYMAEALLEGHLYIDYGDMDEKLLEMENPYDPAARTREGVFYHWDHAFYDGHYYMYFGIVPVILLFLPFRLITGMSLGSLYATQIFAAAYICGVFVVFYLLASKFFRRMTKGMYLLLSSAFALMGIWYSVDAPILYCAAITSALCMEIWSLFFFIKAVWLEQNEKRSILYAFCGSLFGALAFGCRPPVALANLLVLPMLAAYLKEKRTSFRLAGQLAFAASPYIIIAVLLMAYNYARFESPFEFGQTYQLTLADQSSYKNLRIDLLKIWNGIGENFISYKPLSSAFPFVNFGGALTNFPLLLFSVLGLTRKELREEMKNNRLGWFMITLYLLPVLITAADVAWSPFLIERYHLDIYWLLGLLCFMTAGFYFNRLSAMSGKRFSYWMSLGAFAVICTCMLMYLVPYDGNFTMDSPAKLEEIRRVLAFGKNF